MKIESKAQEDEANNKHEKMINLQLIILNQQHAMRKRQVWNSILLLLNFATGAAILHFIALSNPGAYYELWTIISRFF